MFILHTEIQRADAIEVEPTDLRSRGRLLLLYKNIKYGGKYLGKGCVLKYPVPNVALIWLRPSSAAYH